MRALWILVLSAGTAAAQSAAPGTRPLVNDGPPAMLLGSFQDDYGGTFQITATEFAQGPRLRYRVVRWNVEGQCLIAQNAETNASAPNLWTRIDWLTLPATPEMAPYEWAFCLSAYDAPTRAAAESTTIARRDVPKTGCNGFPFSRMKRLAR